MAIKGLERTLDRLRIVLAPDLPDEHLLKKFISSRDEIAFATLVRRHGRMVMGVSRRILGNLHDSEDVLQATFLVLAQKARMVGSREALASWLYKVAYRIALKAKARRDRRRQKETQVDVMPHSSTASPAVHDWEVLLDEELNRLPEKYRLPVILCDLEGRTRKEVEQQLKLAAGTLSSRLTTARRMLAERLTRRGMVFSAGAVWTASSQAMAALPPKLVAAIAQKAVLVAAGQLTAISSSVSILMKAGVKAMFISKLKTTFATVVVLAALGAGGLVYSGGGGEQVGQAKPQSELEKLRRENELLKVNLRVTLEKIQVLENEVRTLTGRDKADGNKLEIGWYVKPRADNRGDSGKKPSGLTPESPLGSREDNSVKPDRPGDWGKPSGLTPGYPLDSRKDNSAKPDRPGDWGKPNGQIPDLGRALNLLREASKRKDAVPENIELLRRAIETLDQVIRQLREHEQDRLK